MQTLHENIRDAASEAGRSGDIELLFNCIDLAEKQGMSEAQIAKAVMDGYQIVEESPTATTYGLNIF